MKCEMEGTLEATLPPNEQKGVRKTLSSYNLEDDDDDPLGFWAV